MISLKDLYSERYNTALKLIAESVEKDLSELLKDIPHVDRISARAKSIDRFIAKARKVEDGENKYEDPLSEIQDQVGARVITFYLKDVEIVVQKILEVYKPIEKQYIIPEKEQEFGYIGQHFILIVPVDLKPVDISRELMPNFFELQVKTLFQHAWSEANHDLCYKPSIPLTTDQKRQVAFTAAQAWGADRIFEELRAELST